MAKEPVYSGVSQIYRLIIDTDLYEYMMTLAREIAPHEILGMGMISTKCYGHHTDFILEEVFVPKQTVSPGYCKFKKGAQNEIIDEVIERGDSPEGLCFRWHSHAFGSVYFSSVDEDDIDHCDSPYVVNLVVNAERDMVARLDVFEPMRIRNIPLKVIVEPSENNELVRECIAELKSCCEIMPSKPKYNKAKYNGLGD